MLHFRSLLLSFFPIGDKINRVNVAVDVVDVAAVFFLFLFAAFFALEAFLLVDEWMDAMLPILSNEA